MAYALKSALAVVAAAALASLAVGPAAAQCKTCGKPGKLIAGKTTKSSSTVRPNRTIVRYRDVRKTRVVGVVNKVVHVRRVIPVTRVSVVTRVHQHTIYPCPSPKCAK